MRRPSLPAGVTTPLLPLWAALLVAAASGPVLDAAFPDKNIWPLAFPGAAAVLVSLVGRRAGSALLVGFIAGLSFYLVHIQWASLFLGVLPMAALSVLESLFVALGALAISLAYRWVPRAFPSTVGRFILLPVVVAGLWTAREAWSAVWPYGGFSWGRIAMSQSESPLSSLFPWLGISGTSFVMVLLVALAVQVARAPRVAGLTATVALATVLVGLPTWQVTTDGTIRVAAAQGAGKAGYFDGSTANELLQAQLDATVPLFGQKNIDVVLWPEGTTYADPLVDPYTQGVFDYVSEQMDAPLIAQGVTYRGDRYFNTAVLWKDGRAADLYDKKHPVPFGEYIPDRAFWRPFAPDLIDMIQREYTPGFTDNVFDVNGVIVGVNICFDIVDDQILTESVEEGARVIFASSNNADFGMTDESAQQLATARIRAMELGRSVVNISTVGLSAVIAADGSIIDELPWFTVGSMVQDVPLSSTVTPAVVIGRQIEWLVSGIGLATIVIAGFAVREKRRGAR